MTKNTSMPAPHFPIELKLRIDWSELDYFGHVNNVSFVKYIQASRVNYWERIGLAQSHRDSNIGPMLASLKCDFKAPLFYPGHVRILARVEFIKTTSFSIFHRLLNDNGETAAEAQDVMVMYDFNRNEKIQFPKELQEKIEHLEKREF